MRNNSKNKITISNLEELLSQAKSKQAIISIAHTCGDNGNPLLKLSLHGDANIAAKASWVFRTWAEMHPKEAKNSTEKVISVLQCSNLDPVLRNILGAVYDNGFPKKFEAIFIDICLGLILERNRAVAVHCNALGILIDLSKKHPALRIEVELALERSQIENTAAFSAQLKKLRKIAKPDQKSNNK
jgi:hypothetical protein